MIKYLRITLPVAVLAATVCALTMAQAAEVAKTKLSANDMKFVKAAYKGNLKEVAEAKMAKEKAKHEATKEVAERMITDHSKSNDRLLEIAKEEGLDLSKMEAKPSSMGGSDFDKEYLTELKADHEKDIAMFEKEAADAKAGEDHDVPSFAKTTLPTLKEHLQMVTDALAKTK